MSKSQREKGRRAEAAVVNYLKANGYPNAERRSSGLPGADITSLGPGLEIEVKNHDQLRFPEWVRQLEAAMQATGADMGAVIAKRAGCTDVADWYFIQPPDLFERMTNPRDWVTNGGSLTKYDDLAAKIAMHCGGLSFALNFKGLQVTKVSTGVELLRRAGYGDPIQEEA